MDLSWLILKLLELVPRVMIFIPQFFLRINYESLHIFAIVTWSFENRVLQFSDFPHLLYWKMWIQVTSYHCGIWSLILCASTQDNRMHHKIHMQQNPLDENSTQIQAESSRRWTLCSHSLVCIKNNSCFVGIQPLLE